MPRSFDAPKRGPERRENGAQRANKTPRETNTAHPGCFAQRARNRLKTKTLLCWGAGGWAACIGDRTQFWQLGGKNGKGTAKQIGEEPSARYARSGQNLAFTEILLRNAQFDPPPPFRPNILPLAPLPLP